MGYENVAVGDRSHVQAISSDFSEDCSRTRPLAKMASGGEVKQTKLRAVVRVALCLRVSTTEQTKGHSLDSQRDTLKTWAGREGWIVAAVCEDPGTSGTNAASRPAFHRMVADAQAGKFDAILVLKNDRFARSTRDAPLYREVLADCGVRVLSNSEPTVGGGANAFFMEGISDLNAAYYSVLLSENVSRGMSTRAQKGLILGDVPFGYRHQGPQEPPELIQDEADAVRRCFEDYAVGNRSMSEIADGLT